MKAIFLGAAIVGAAVPLWFLAAFFRTNGLDLTAFVRQLGENNVSIFFALDVVISGLVLWLFIFREGRRQGMRHLWLYVLCTFLVGVSFAFPLFLFVREQRTKSHKFMSS